MPYVEGRVVHDADAHIMETAEFLAQFAPERIRGHLLGFDGSAAVATPARQVEKVLARHADPDYRARDAEELMSRKNWAATGAYFKADRPKALDLLGFSSQLVFNTFVNGHMARLERTSTDLDLVYGVAETHNRAMLDFCSSDRRLLPTAYVPLADFERTRALASDCIAQGFSGLLVPSQCPRTHSPSHTGLLPLWRAAEEAGLPILFHVGGGGVLLDPNYFVNGLPVPPDFHGGAENFRSVDYMAIPTPVMQTLATLLIDGVFHDHPNLKFGVIEQGAGWIPSWMRYLDSAYDAFARHEERLQRLTMRPSEYVRRQLRATPYPTEDVGWIVREAGAEIPLFSSDYPHVEGGRNPIKRFETTLVEATPGVRDAFYRGNFADLMGSALPARGLAA
jgi:predicted TIM-barrel fold metal-dependent hydrolase